MLRSLQVQVTNAWLVITDVALHVQKIVRIKFNKTFTRVRLVFLQDLTLLDKWILECPNKSSLYALILHVVWVAKVIDTLDTLSVDALLEILPLFYFKCI